MELSKPHLFFQSSSSSDGETAQIPPYTCGLISADRPVGLLRSGQYVQDLQVAVAGLNPFICLPTRKYKGLVWIDHLDLRLFF